MKIRQYIGMLALVAFLGALTLHSQTVITPLSPEVVVKTAYPLTSLTATAAVANATTLTIPAPTQSGYYNYVCYLAMEGSNDNTATAVSVATGSSTNFNGWANKFSAVATASLDSGPMVYLNLSPPGCVKSQSPTTATTFVSPNSTHEAYTWYASYYQGL